LARVRAFKVTQVRRRRWNQFIIIYLVILFYYILFRSCPRFYTVDWEAYLLDDMKTSTRINGFLWNRVSQGYSRVVQDESPFEGWSAWRAGHRDREPEPLPYRTPATSPELPIEPGESAAAAADQTQVAVLAAGCGVGINEDDIIDMTCEEILTGSDGAGLTLSQVRALPIRMAPGGSSQASQSTSTSTSTSTSGGLRRRWIRVGYTAPERMELTAIHCTFSPMEDIVQDVGNLSKDVPSRIRLSCY
jgi:hypothetical protein